jgi:FkbM family methyltransferase
MSAKKSVWKSYLWRFYHGIPFKKELFSVIKPFYTPSQTARQRLYFLGPFHVPCGEKGFLLQNYGYFFENSIFWTGLTGAYEGISMSLWMKLCRDSQTIVDIGANTGIYSLVARALNPTAKIYAFEPVERVFNRMVENVKLNHYDIEMRMEAATNTDGFATVFDVDAEHEYSATLNKDFFTTHPASEGVIERKIVAKRIDTFIREEKVAHIDLMKIDVEMHEPEVLEGMVDCLKTMRPTLLIEVLSDEMGARVNALLQGRDYLFFNIDEKNAPKRVARVEKALSTNVLACSEAVARRLELL